MSWLVILFVSAPPILYRLRSGVLVENANHRKGKEKDLTVPESHEYAVCSEVLISLNSTGNLELKVDNVSELGDIRPSS
jgi:hypothetical protein